MKSRLLASFLTVLIFWWMFFLFKWGLGSLQENFDSLINIKRLLPFLSIKVPETGIAQALYIQIAVLKTWTIPLVIIGAISALIGVSIVWMYAVRYNNDRKDRVKPKGKWRGAYIGALGGGGGLPEPVYLNRLKLPNETLLAHPKVQSLPEHEIVTLREVLETIYAYPDAYCGDGHDTTLYQHTINVLNKLMEKKEVTGKMLIVAAAHDMGKITAFKKNSKGKWDRVKKHDKESAHMLALVPSFWNFDESDRRVMLLATKYTHTPGNMPSYDAEDRLHKMAMDILHIIHEADKTATKEEKQRVLDKAELEKLVLESFLNALSTLHFQKPGLPKGAISSGWKIKGRIYLNEIQVRETCMKNLDKDIRAALGGNYREKTEVTPFTSALLKAFSNEKWLVTQINDKTVDASEALWKIKAGTREFNGVIIIDNLPIKVKDMLDPADTTYKLEVMGPQFEREVVEADTLGLFKDTAKKEIKKEDKAPEIKMSPKDESHKKGYVESTNLDLNSYENKKESEINVVSENTSEINNSTLPMIESVSNAETLATEIESSHTEITPLVETVSETTSITIQETKPAVSISEDSSSGLGFSISGFLGEALANENSTTSNEIESVSENQESVETNVESVIDVKESSTEDLAKEAQKLINEDNKQKMNKPKNKGGGYDSLFK